MFLQTADPTGAKFFWIGLTDLFHEGKFVWSSMGQEAFYTNWRKDEPDNWFQNEHFVDIGSMYFERKWNDIQESQTGTYALCQFSL